ncbi:MAG: aldehyde dehydrogenase family protein, partial [Actinophytocola sp.]|nr:aldehyde dehydrogenase family protein [Actinophytocola sp.]
ELASHLSSIRLGDPLDELTTMGPLISADHLARVESWTDRGLQDGATSHRITCSSMPEGDGFYAAPSLFTDVTPEMPIAQEEIFGPVVAVARFEAEAEAVQVANQLRYGLTASIWTENLRRAHRVAHAVEAGYVWVNDVGAHYPGMPFGGFKDSGIGREESAEEIASYTQTKSVHINFG